jgi:hypothetical protein
MRPPQKMCNAIPYLLLAMECNVIIQLKVVQCHSLSVVQWMRCNLGLISESAESLTSYFNMQCNVITITVQNQCGNAHILFTM